MKKIFLLLFVILTCATCKKKSCCALMDVQFEVVYKDANGADLLNPALAGAIKAEDIDIYVLKNGIRTNRHRLKMFEIKKSSQNFYFVSISFDVLSDNFEGNKITYIVRYKDGTEDQFIGEFNADREVNIFLQRVWVNGILKWDIGPNYTKPEPILIIK